jgi:TPR repeat protein
MKYFLLFIVLVFSPYILASEIDLLTEKAKSGDLESQFLLASKYDAGLGVKPNGKKAKKWYKKAAEGGHAEAQNSLGSIYQVSEKYAKAIMWYEKAVIQNHALATNNLAYLYDLGLGVKQNRQKGFDLYTKAANLGWAESMWNIANMYGSGQLGEKDLYRACIWTFKAKKYIVKSQQRLNEQLQKIIPYLEGELSKKDYLECQNTALNWTATINE